MNKEHMFLVSIYYYLLVIILVFIVPSYTLLGFIFILFSPLFCSNFIYQLIVHYSEYVYIYTDMYRNL